MKRKGLLFASVLVLVGLLGACSSNSDEPKVNSGTTDENYVGDPAPVLEENYLQSPAEEKVQKEVLDKIKDQDNTGDGPSIHGL